MSTTLQDIINSANKALAEITESQADIIPEGWYTCDEYAETWGIPYNTARDRLNRLLNNNRMVKAKFYVDKGAVGCRPKTHYKLKEEQ